MAGNVQGSGEMLAGSSSGEVTELLHQVAQGDQNAAAKLIPLVYAEMRRRAAAYMRAERPDHTLEPTILVHDAYLDLVGRQDVNWQSRAHFFGLAADQMRRILIDHARAHLREKRGGGQRKISLEEGFLFTPEKSEEVLAVDECLDRLAKIDPRRTRILVLRFFGGLTNEETAEVMGISLNTVKRDLQVAKAWLYAELRERHGMDSRKLGSS
ncbi:MAG: sigma-70 family RNA polymerase sigma factor [Candidatus Sulfotelmatobacter sp.]